MNKVDTQNLVNELNALIERQHATEDNKETLTDILFQKLRRVSSVTITFAD
jgi:hypothetical protein